MHRTMCSIADGPILPGTTCRLNHGDAGAIWTCWTARSCWSCSRTGTYQLQGAITLISPACSLLSRCC